MSKFTGVALLLSGVGISIYSLSAGTVSRSTGTIFSSPPQTAALPAGNGSEQGEPQNVIQTRPGLAGKIAANNALPHSQTPAATPGSYSAKRPLLLEADAAQRSPAPRITKQVAQTKRAEQSKQPWWRFALPSWDAAPKKVALAQLKSKTGGTARVNTSPLSSRSGQNAQIDKYATDLDADLLDHTAPNSSRQAVSAERSTERSTERKIAQARKPGGIIVPTLIATVGEATTTSEESGFDQLRPADEQARFLLAKNLQKELYRVGCYRGSIDGKWGRASRRAMRNFTDQVKATLPVSEPDYILLTLVQGHASQACSLPCSEVNGGSARQRCSDEGLIFAAEHSQRKARLAVQSPPLLAPPLPERPTTVSRKPLIAFNKRKPGAATREFANTDPAAIALPTRRSRQLAGKLRAPSTAAARGRQLTSKNRRSRQFNRITRASRKVPLPGRMTIGAGARARAARLEQYSESSGPTSPRLAPAPRLRDDQFSSRIQLGSDRGALIRSPTSLRSTSTQTEVARIRAEARAAVKQASALAEANSNTRTNAHTLVRTEPARRRRLAGKRRPNISKPKYFVGAKKHRVRKKGPSAARIRAWKRKAWKRTYYQDQVNNGR